MKKSKFVLLACSAVMFSSGLASLQANAASEDDIQRARNHLRCASFYVFGSMDVKRPELKVKLKDLANRSLVRAETLFDQDRPRTKKEFEAAREKFHAELLTDEVKADGAGFLKYMGEYCAAQREK